MKLINPSFLLLTSAVTIFIMTKGVHAFDDDFVGDAYTILFEGEFMFSREAALGNRCRIELGDDGNLVTKRNGRVTWSTGPAPMGENANYRLTVTGQGSLLVEVDRDDGIDVYRTVRDAIPEYSEYFKYNWWDAEYSLVFDTDCNIHVMAKIWFQGSQQQIPVWSNMKKELTKMDVMLRGDILQGTFHLCCDSKRYCVDVQSFLVLQNDCNLVQYVGNDLSDKSDVVWSPGIGLGEGSECYVYVGENFIGAYEGTFYEDERDLEDPRRDRLYWQSATDNWEETQVLSDEGFYAD